jgi:hypothetical protein
MRFRRGGGGLAAKRRKRRRSGSIGSLKSALWATITYNLDVIEDDERDHELRQKACNCLVQAALAYGRVLELYDLERDVKQLEHLSASNGHHPT